MCLILFSFNTTSTPSLILASNRDEFLDRPTAAAHYWSDQPHVLAGRDLTSQGTWLGITTTGRFAAVTNVREPHITVDNALSRGALTQDFLQGTQTPAAYLESLQPTQQRYSGFNLLVGDFSLPTPSLYYMSNRREGIEALASGTYGLSNHLLDSEWPKVKQAKDMLKTIDPSLVASSTPLHTTLRDALENQQYANDDDLPKTGISYEREKALPAMFIDLSHAERAYGTRASTVLTVEQNQIVL